MAIADRHMTKAPMRKVIEQIPRKQYASMDISRSYLVLCAAVDRTLFAAGTATYRP